MNEGRCEQTMWTAERVKDHRCHSTAQFVLVRNGRELRLCGIHVLAHRTWDRRAGLDSEVRGIHER